MFGKFGAFISTTLSRCIPGLPNGTPCGSATSVDSSVSQNENSSSPGGCGERISTNVSGISQTQSSNNTSGVGGSSNGLPWKNIFKSSRKDAEKVAAEQLKNRRLAEIATRVFIGDLVPPKIKKESGLSRTTVTDVVKAMPNTLNKNLRESLEAHRAALKLTGANPKRNETYTLSELRSGLFEAATGQSTRPEISSKYGLPRTSVKRWLTALQRSLRVQSSKELRKLAEDKKGLATIKAACKTFDPPKGGNQPFLTSQETFFIGEIGENRREVGYGLNKRALRELMRSVVRKKGEELAKRASSGDGNHNTALAKRAQKMLDGKLSGDFVLRNIRKADEDMGVKIAKNQESFVKASLKSFKRTAAGSIDRDIEMRQDMEAMFQDARKKGLLNGSFPEFEDIANSDEKGFGSAGLYMRIFASRNNRNGDKSRMFLVRESDRGHNKYWVSANLTVVGSVILPPCIIHEGGGRDAFSSAFALNLPPDWIVNVTDSGYQDKNGFCYVVSQLVKHRIATKRQHKALFWLIDGADPHFSSDALDYARANNIFPYFTRSENSTEDQILDNGINAVFENCYKEEFDIHSMQYPGVPYTTFYFNRAVTAAFKRMLARPNIGEVVRNAYERTGIFPFVTSKMLTNPSPSDGLAVKQYRKRVIVSTKLALPLMQDFERKKVLALLRKIDVDNLLGDDYEKEIVEKKSDEEGEEIYDYVITRRLKRKNDSSITSQRPNSSAEIRFAISKVTADIVNDSVVIPASQLQKELSEFHKAKKIKVGKVLIGDGSQTLSALNASTKFGLQVTEDVIKAAKKVEETRAFKISEAKLKKDASVIKRVADVRICVAARRKVIRVFHDGDDGEWEKLLAPVLEKSLKSFGGKKEKGETKANVVSKLRKYLMDTSIDDAGNDDVDSDDMDVDVDVDDSGGFDNTAVDDSDDDDNGSDDNDDSDDDGLENDDSLKVKKQCGTLCSNKVFSLYQKYRLSKKAKDRDQWQRLKILDLKHAAIALCPSYERKSGDNKGTLVALLRPLLASACKTNTTGLFDDSSSSSSDDDDDDDDSDADADADADADVDEIVDIPEDDDGIDDVSDEVGGILYFKPLTPEIGGQHNKHIFGLKSLFVPLTFAEVITSNDMFHQDLTDETVVSQVLGEPVTYKSFKMLQDAEWLGDEVVHQFLKLLAIRESLHPIGDGIHFFKSFFFTRLLNEEGGGYKFSNVSRWSKFAHNGNIFELTRLIIPCHISNSHWALTCVFFEEKKIIYYDSLFRADGRRNKTRRNKYTSALLRYLKDEWKKLVNNEFDIDEWTIENAVVPQQSNYDDCGVFACLFAEHLARGLHANTMVFQQSDIPLVRRRMALDIWKHFQG